MEVENRLIIVEKSNVAESMAAPADLAAINAFTRRELAAEEVYTFAVRACDDQPDRDNERFTVQCLDKLAKMYPGKPVIFDHTWSASAQTARVYAAEVVTAGNEHFLRMSVYMLRSEATKPIIDAIDAGILREVSVCVSCGSVTCNICHMDYCSCGHQRGQNYDGVRCVPELDDPMDAYELSFVAVPAQPKAGVTKAAGQNSMSINDVDQAKSRVAIEKIRFGG